MLSSEVPDGWNTAGDVSYPWAQSYKYVSGVNESAGSTPSDAVRAVAVYNYYSTLFAQDYGSQAVGKYFKDDTVRTKGAKPNKLGLYDMTGNVWEWAEDWYDETKRYLSCGSWYNPGGHIYIGNVASNKPNSRINYFGTRFCVSLPSSN